MFYTILKILISAILIGAISEIAKRSSVLNAILASIPLVSVLAMIWLYVDTQNTQDVVMLSKGIFWLVLPSLILFLSFPLLIKLQWNFYAALAGAIVLTIIAYFLMIMVLNKLGVKL
jgi:hypothetical protein